ncbi:MAG: glycosyltransferase family 2 protein [bacterium]
MNISAVIVSYNGEKYLPSLLKSLQKQTCAPAEVILVDNGSTDQTVSVFRDFYPAGRVIQNPGNLGFARAGNQGMRACSHPFCLLLNQDVVLTPGYIRHLYEALSTRPNCAGATGLLLNPFGEVDSAGHQAFTDRILIDRKSFSGFQEEVFSIPATATLYSLSALKQIAYQKEEIFDELFFSYLEDVDLGYRAQFAGFSFLFVPWAIAIHFRHSSSLRSSLPFLWKTHKNYPLILLKYETFFSFLRDSPEILPFLVLRFFRTLFTRPILVFSDFQILLMWREIQKRRKFHAQIQKRTWSNLRAKMTSGRLWRKLLP